MHRPIASDGGRDLNMKRQRRTNLLSVGSGVIHRESSMQLSATAAGSFGERDASSSSSAPSATGDFPRSKPKTSPRRRHSTRLEATPNSDESSPSPSTKGSRRATTAKTTGARLKGSAKDVNTGTTATMVKKRKRKSAKKGITPVPNRLQRKGIQISKRAIAKSKEEGPLKGTERMNTVTEMMSAPKKPKIDNRKKRTEAGAVFQRKEMLNHDILTKEQETDLGRKVVAAQRLRAAVGILLDERQLEMEMEAESAMFSYEDLSSSPEEMDYDFLAYELDYLSLYGFRVRSSDETMSAFEEESERSSKVEHSEHKSEHLSQMSMGGNFGKTDEKRQADMAGYSSLVHLRLDQLTDDDIVGILDIPGGRLELSRILLDGSWARNTLMRQNVKLVVSIAKGWIKRHSPKTAAEGAMIARIYEGGWDRPSLDEAVQDGVLGLARAVDKYDPERGLRFSTYATHWITSYVRVCFQRAATGCVRVPSQLHNVKSAYQKLVKDCLESGEPVPAQKSIAKQLGVSENRLLNAIRATEGLTSIDAPAFGNGGAHKGSSAGGDQTGAEILISDTLHSMEPKAEDQIDMSFLRQCLENAMATELTPYERDVLRLRLGLDSGETKTVREVSEICGGGVTMAEVREAERRAFKKLRSPTSVHTHNLLSYLDVAGVDKSMLLRR